jgi:nucleotide-binding universal stress UspA family protein
MKNIIKPIDSNLILVPTDFTEVAGFAMQHASELAKLFHKTICLLHVVETGLLESGTVERPERGGSIAKLRQAAEKNQEASGIETTFVTRRGNIFDTIGSIADELNAALVVMGTHGVSECSMWLAARRSV